MKFFQRTAELTVGSRSFAGLDISFEVERDDGGGTNKATIKVANLSKDSRGYVDAKGRTATLSAGYGDNPGVIFNGSITRAFSERSGPDIITTLECADGGEALRLATVDVAHQPGVTDQQVLELGLKALRARGIGRGYVASFVPEVYTRGFSFSGPVRELLDQVCSKRGLSWSIQNGQVEVLVKGTAHPGRSYLLRADTGLVGFPTAKAGLLTAKSLLNPGLVPNKMVRLESQETRLNGSYVINKVKFSGDLREAEFVAEIEGSRVEAKP